MSKREEYTTILVLLVIAAALMYWADPTGEFRYHEKSKDQGLVEPYNYD